MDKAYAYKNKRSVVMRSSSGGAFWGIAEAFFEMGGGGTLGGPAITYSISKKTG